MIYITRKETFTAAHKLFKAEWSDEKNLNVFGKCANPNWHGHNYILFVTVKGKINPETSFVTNLSDLSTILKKKIIDKVDHKNLNLDVDFMKTVLPSTENLVVEIWKQIQDDVASLGCQLHCVKIQETEKNYVEYFGN